MIASATVWSYKDLIICKAFKKLNNHLYQCNFHFQSSWNVKNSQIDYIEDQYNQVLCNYKYYYLRRIHFHCNLLQKNNQVLYKIRQANPQSNCIHLVLIQIKSKKKVKKEKVKPMQIPLVQFVQVNSSQMVPLYPSLQRHVLHPFNRERLIKITFVQKFTYTGSIITSSRKAVDRTSK